MKKMLYLVILAGFLSGCTTSPGIFDAKVTSRWYRPEAVETGVDAYSLDYGIVTIYNSPFYEKVRVGDMVAIGCTRTKGLFAPANCAILGIKK